MDLFGLYDAVTVDMSKTWRKQLKLNYRAGGVAASGRHWTSAYRVLPPETRVSFFLLAQIAAIDQSLNLPRFRGVALGFPGP